MSIDIIDLKKELVDDLHTHAYFYYVTDIFLVHC